MSELELGVLHVLEYVHPLHKALYYKINQSDALVSRQMKLGFHIDVAIQKHIFSILEADEGRRTFGMKMA